MPTELTAIVTVWPSPRRGSRPGQYELLENFRPVWRAALDAEGRSLVCPVRESLAAAMTMHLAYEGGLFEVPGFRFPPPGPLPPAGRAARLRSVFRLFRGRALAVVRFNSSCLSDAEVRMARAEGVMVDMLDAASMPEAGDWR